jgi:predicted ATPase
MIIESARVIGARADSNAWPFTLPCVKALVDAPLTFTSAITIFVGENGSGKSTLIEGLAQAHGLDIRGGHGNRRYSSNLEKEPLAAALQLAYGATARTMKSRSSGFFLRAETAHGMLTAMSDFRVAGYGERHAAMVSHGESYLQVLEGRFTQTGLYLLDEPESPLSFESCLVLIRVLHDAVANGSQVICATHSPVLAAIPHAQILQLDEEGINEVEWEDLDTVAQWRGYLADPERYLRHVLASEG